MARGLTYAYGVLPKNVTDVFFVNGRRGSPLGGGFDFLRSRSFKNCHLESIISSLKIDMNIESLICITLNPQFLITNVTTNGLRFLGYSGAKALESQNISVLIPMPAAFLHDRIFSELQKTFTDKQKYIEIVKLGDNSMNDGVHANTIEDIIERLHDPRAVKKVMTFGGKEKRAAIYIDMKMDRHVSVYLLPIPETPSLSRSASPAPSLCEAPPQIDRGPLIESMLSGSVAAVNHEKASDIDRRTASTPALVAVLRAIKEL
jgi:hypothetical protein